MCVAYAAYNMRLLISKMRCAMRPRSRYMFEVIYIIAGVGRLLQNHSSTFPLYTQSSAMVKQELESAYYDTYMLEAECARLFDPGTFRVGIRLHSMHAGGF
jgi:hypothetical protein